ncbi:MAG: WecB/TagA/CpsF family glycosyltransferase [Actinomycetota bacterium]
MVDQKCPGYVILRDAHGVVASQSDSELRAAHNRAALVLADGWPLVALARLQGIHGATQARGSDLLRELLAHAETTDWKIVVFGGDDRQSGVIEARLREMYPRLHLCGSVVPPVMSAADLANGRYVSEVQSRNADVVLVALSSPKQELWMSSVHSSPVGAVLIGVGAAVNIVTGQVKESPVWLRRIGMEWMYRIIQEPRRLVTRYLLVVPSFALLILGEAIRTLVNKFRGRVR